MACGFVISKADTTDGDYGAILLIRLSAYDSADAFRAMATVGVGSVLLTAACGRTVTTADVRHVPIFRASDSITSAMCALHAFSVACEGATVMGVIYV